jgi:hypothetical protein
VAETHQAIYSRAKALFEESDTPRFPATQGFAPSKLGRNIQLQLRSYAIISEESIGSQSSCAGLWGQRRRSLRLTPSFAYSQLSKLIHHLPMVSGLNAHSPLFHLGLLPLKILFYLGFRLHHLKGIAQKESIALSGQSCDKAYPSKVERRTSYRTNLTARLEIRLAISPIHGGTGTLGSSSGLEARADERTIATNSGLPRTLLASYSSHKT